MMFFRFLIPIALLQVLPSRGEDLFDALFLSDLIDSDMGECFEGFDVMEDPFPTTGDYCGPNDATKFNDALDEFKTCSNFDLKAIIETISSASLGLIVSCGSYSSQVMYNPFELPRVPDECVDALVGDNPFGNMVLQMYKYPHREMACFADLAEALPACTLNEWPVPIVGNWLKSISCLFGESDSTNDPMVNTMVSSQLEGLSECLPLEISEENCQDVVNECANTDDLIINMYLPAPFNGAPLPTFYHDVAAGDERLESALNQFEEYRQSCIPAEDRMIWERVVSDFSQTAFISGVKKAGPTKFFIGFLTGAILMCVGFLVTRGESKKSTQFHIDSELKSFELSENRTMI